MACQPTIGLTAIYLQTKLKDHLPGLGVTCGQQVELPAVIGFLDLDYRFISEATQIPHDGGLGPLPYTGRKFFFYRGSN